MNSFPVYLCIFLSLSFEKKMAEGSQRVCDMLQNKVSNMKIVFPIFFKINRMNKIKRKWGKASETGQEFNLLYKRIF